MYTGAHREDHWSTEQKPGLLYNVRQAQVIITVAQTNSTIGL